MLEGIIRERNQNFIKSQFITVQGIGKLFIFVCRAICEFEYEHVLCQKQANHQRKEHNRRNESSNTCMHNEDIIFNVVVVDNDDDEICQFEVHIY